MVSLVDIVDVKKTVTIRGAEIEVSGINAQGIGTLLVNYPELRLVFGGRVADVTPDMILGLGPKIVASIIAMGIGKVGDAAEEAAAAKLTIGELVTIIAAIIEATFPDGWGPFVARLRSLGFDAEAVAAGGPGWAPGTNSQKPSSASQTAAETMQPS